MQKFADGGRHRLRRPWLACCLLLLTASCQIEAPERPAVDIVDEVTAIDRAALIGGWNCRELDPYPGQPVLVQQLTFNGDGTFRAVATAPLERELTGGRLLETATTGNWRVDGDIVEIRDTIVETAARGGHRTAGALGILDETTAEFGTPSGIQGSAKTLRLTEEELVLRGLEADAPTWGCKRT